MTLKPIIITRHQWRQMQAHVTKVFPQEACGLLAGSDSKVQTVMQVKNTLESKVNFRMDAHEQLRCFLEIEKENWELLGIYHSHPSGPAYPSCTDIEESYYPDSAYLIWALENGEWICKAYDIKHAQVFSRDIIIE